MVIDYVNNEIRINGSASLMDIDILTDKMCLNVFEWNICERMIEDDYLNVPNIIYYSSIDFLYTPDHAVLDVVEFKII